MKRYPSIILLVLGFLVSGMCRTQAAETDAATWDVQSLSEEGDFEYEFTTGLITADEGVVVTYGDTRLTASRLQLNRRTGVAVATGVVTLEQGGYSWQSSRLEYDFFNRKILSQGEDETFRMGRTPFFVSGMTLEAKMDENEYVIGDGFVTTDDLAEPGHRIRAKRLTLVPGEYVEARGATVYMGKVPVFYWPRYRRTFEGSTSSFDFVPGYRSIFGAYLETDYNFTLVPQKVKGTLNFDWRSKRGYGGGADFDYNLGTLGFGRTGIYHTDDRAPGLSSIGTPLESGRRRIHFTHRVNIQTNLTLKANVRYQSDEFVARDFFESEYRQHLSPPTFAEAVKYWRNFSLNIMAQPQVNDFFERVERLPDVRLTSARQKLGRLPLYYEGESSFGYFRRQFAFNSLPEYAAVRADSFHQVVYPMMLANRFSLVPRVGGRLTHYGESEGAGIPFQEENRFVFNTGAELSTKISRTWAQAGSRFWDVDGLRHIVEPSINYVYVPKPNVRPNQLPQFDTLYPSLRLIPIEYPDFNSIDSVDAQNVIRLGWRNRLQTRRDENLTDFLNWAIYADWRLAPLPGQSTFSDAFSDLAWRARDWLTLNSELRYDVGSEVLRSAYHSFAVEPGDRWSLRLGHFYFRQTPGFGALSQNNLLSSDFYLRMNENWGLRFRHFFEARDGKLQEQYYSLYRDLRSWTGALTFRVRQNGVGPDDFTVAFTFSLKASPRLGLGADSVQPSRLLGQ